MIFSRRRFLAAFASVLLLAPLAGWSRSHPTRPAATPTATASYKGAIVMDAATGKVIFEENADIVSPPASMTKLMTFLVLQDYLKSGALTLQTPVTVMAADSKIGGTQVWLKEHEVFPVEELLYAMMIQSANDAAYALARTAAGSAEAFVEKMNAKARELGMTHTTFRSPHGLPPASRRISEGDLTSPRDFAILSRALVTKTDVLKYTSVKTRPFGPPVRTTAVVMNNHNHLLGRVAGVDGLKTGFTNGAGYCLAATAMRNGHRIIAVSMGTSELKSRDIKMAELIERGFANLPPGSPTFTPFGSGTTPSDAPFSAVPAASVPATDAKKSAPADDSTTIKLNIPKR